MSDTTATKSDDPIKDDGPVKDAGPKQDAGPGQDDGPPSRDADKSRVRLVSGIAAVVLLASLAYGITAAVTAQPEAQAPAEPAQADAPNWPADDIRSLLAVRPTSAAVVDSLARPTTRSASTKRPRSMAAPPSR